MNPVQAECAAKIVEVVPFAIRHLRAHIRSQKDRQFTIPQFRVLAYLHYHAAGTLSDLALSQGVSLPTMSKLVGSLVQRKLVERKGNSEDRRKLKLKLTREGTRVYDASLQSTRQYVAAKLELLSENQLEGLTQALDLLQGIFEQS
ncbi:MAG: MarR family transcriptional regulator [Chloroflexi bacterium]|nr:MarR family transcriptional regulator [Chloroflexota bacterium]MBI3734200.1 MarR family transcriptional regulator [Chloroflexota bacterium]